MDGNKKDLPIISVPVMQKPPAPPETKDPLVRAIKSVDSINPAYERVQQLDKDISEIYNSFVRVVKKSKDPDTLGEGLKILMSYRRQMVNDPILMAFLISKLNSDEKSIALAAAKKLRLIRAVSKDKDPQILFGKK